MSKSRFDLVPCGNDDPWSRNSQIAAIVQNFEMSNLATVILDLEMSASAWREVLWPGLFFPAFSCSTCHQMRRMHKSHFLFTPLLLNVQHSTAWSIEPILRLQSPNDIAFGKVASQKRWEGEGEEPFLTAKHCLSVPPPTGACELLRASFPPSPLPFNPSSAGSQSKRVTCRILPGQKHKTWARCNSSNPQAFPYSIEAVLITDCYLSACLPASLQLAQL